MIMKSLILTLILTAFSYANNPIKITIDNKIINVPQKELKELYLKERTTINGIKVIPVDTKDNQLFKEFYSKVIKKTPQQLRAYWMKEIFRGDKQPPKRVSNAGLKKLIKQKTPVLSYRKNSKTGQILLTIK